MFPFTGSRYKLQEIEVAGNRTQPGDTMIFSPKTYVLARSIASAKLALLQDFLGFVD